jgi:hypothetical protein
MASPRHPREPQRTSEPLELSVYDGRELLGHIVEQGRTFTAVSWPDQTRLGTFSTRRLAAAALSTAGPSAGSGAQPSQKSTNAVAHTSASKWGAHND